MNKRKFNLSGVIAAVIAVLILVAVIPINIIANYYDKSFDMTPSKIYSLSDTTVSLVEETSDKAIDIYFMYDIDDLRAIPEFLPLYHTMVQLDKYDNITLHDVVPDENPELVEQLSSTGNLSIDDGDVIVKCGDTIKRVNAAAVFPYNDEGISTYAGEELIAGAIKIVTNGTLPKIYFLTGHGEKTINDNYASFANMLKTTNNYEAAELDLNSIDAVPDDAAIIFLAGPQSDITDSEKEKLLAYCDKGGAMAFFMAPVDNDVIFENVEDILEAYELEMHYNILEETNPDYILNNAAGESDPNVFRVEYTPTSDSFTVDLTTEINSLISSEGIIGGISNTRSFAGLDIGSQFIEKSSIINNTSTINDVTGAYSYTAQSIPCGGNDKTAEYAEALSGALLSPGYYSYNKQNGSKLLAIGTTDVLDSETMSMSIAVTQQLVQNSLIWLFNSDYDMNIGDKGVTFDYMSFKSAEQAESTLRIFTIIPVCVAAVGVIVWLKRRYS